MIPVTESRTKDLKARFRLGDNLGLKALSLGLAVLGWILAHGEQTYQDTVVVPVDYLQPSALVLLNDTALPERVVIQVSGSQGALKALKSQVREGALQYLVNLEEAEPGRTVHSFRLPPVGMPSLVTMHTVSPAEVELHFDDLSSRTLPVQLRVRGDLPQGYIETHRTIEPSFVTLMGARTELADLHAVPTIPMRLGEMRESTDQLLALDLSGMHMHPDSATAVQVTLGVAEVTGELQISNVPVVSRDKKRFSIAPSLCEVSLFGPLPVLAQLGAESVRAEIVGQLGDKQIASKEVHELSWDPLRSSESEAGIQIKVAHARAGEVVVTKVVPGMFQISTTETGAASEAPKGGN